MPYHNPYDGPVIISAKAAFFRFPADAYSPAVWDETLASYVAAAGLVLVASVPAGAVEAEINKTYQESTIHVDVVPADVAAIVGGIAGGTTQAQLATQLAAILNRIIVAPATQATLAAILAKIIAAPATEATLGRLVAGIAIPQADAVTIAAGWLAAVAIPANAKSIDFLLDVAAYVVADAAAGDPAQDGVPYQPNLNFRVPCQGATHLHLKRVAGDATINWTVIL